METTNDILCEMRTLGQIYNKSTDKITRSVQSLGLRSYADRFEAARRRETVTICNHLNEILNEANGIAESVTSDYIEKKARRICDLCKQIDLQGNGAAMREREATCEKSSQVGNAAVAHSRGGFDYDFHDVLKRLASVCWHETMFADMQTYYAEEGVYVMRCKHGTPNAHYCIIRAKSLDEAISRAVFDLHKANESRELGVSKTDTATHKQPVTDCNGLNGAKCREALENITLHFCKNCPNNGPDGCELSEAEGRFEFLCHNLKQARAALSAPPEPIGNTAKMHDALLMVKKLFDGRIMFQPAIREAHKAVDAALSYPPRNCDVMPLETARKVWYVKEILPRLIGDLPLGKEVPFEEWFVSQQEQGGAK